MNRVAVSSELVRVASMVSGATSDVEFARTAMRIFEQRLMDLRVNLRAKLERFSDMSPKVVTALREDLKYFDGIAEELKARGPMEERMERLIRMQRDEIR